MTLVLGLVSLFVSLGSLIACAPVGLAAIGLGIWAVLLAGREARGMNEGTIDPSGRGQVVGGKVCGIIGIVLGGLALLLTLIAVVRFAFNASKMK